jgi:hypothetical protein
LYQCKNDTSLWVFMAIVLWSHVELVHSPIGHSLALHPPVVVKDLLGLEAYADAIFALHLNLK